MKCPKCVEKTNEMKIEGIDIDFCSSCKGIWFDKDELPFMVELTKEELSLEKMAQDAQKTEWACPTCETKLEEFLFHDTKDLHVDRCPDCHGVWLDKGELAKVENVAAKISDPHSKIMGLCKYFHDHGYQVLGMQTQGQ